MILFFDSPIPPKRQRESMSVKDRLARVEVGERNLSRCVLYLITYKEFFTYEYFDLFFYYLNYAKQKNLIKHIILTSS